MEKLKKIAILLIIILSYLFSVFYLSKSNELSNYLVGICTVLLYSSNFLLVDFLEKFLNINKKNNFYPLFLKLLVPLYTIKFISRHIYKNNIYYLMAIIFSIVVIIFYEYKVNKIYYKKALLKIENIELFIIGLIPFYLFKNGDIEDILKYLIPISIIKIIMKKGLELNKNIKKIYYLYSIFIIILIGSILLNPLVTKGKMALENIFCWITFIIILLQIDYKKIDYKNILLVSLSSIMIFYSSIIKYYSNLNISSITQLFKYYRLGSHLDITQTGAILGVVQILILYFMIFNSKIEILPYYIINFIFLLSTGSKGPVLLVILISIYMIINKVDKKYIKYILLGVIIAIIFISKMDLTVVERIKNTKSSSNQIRMLLYKESLKQIKESIVFGKGYGTYLDNIKIDKNRNLTYIKKKAYYNMWYEHSTPLQLMRSSGVFSAIAYYSIIGYFLYNLYIFYRRKKEKIFLLGILIIGYFEIYGIIDNVLIYDRLEIIYLLIISLIYFLGIKKEVIKNERNNFSWRKWNKTLSNNESDIKTDKSNI